MRVLMSGTWRTVDEIAAILNHPGHSSQKSHGRKGGGLADAKTTAEVNTAAAAAAKGITGRDIAFDFGASDPQVAREHAEGVLKGLEKFPDAPLERVSVSDNVRGGFAHTVPAPGGGLAIEFSGQYAGMDPGDYRAKIAAASMRVPRMGEGAQFKEPSHIAIHEFGHVASMGRARDNSNRDIAEAHAKKAIAEGTHYSYRQVVSEQVSIYGASDSLELSAEAFTDVMVNGGDASSLSQAIYANIESGYR